MIPLAVVILFSIATFLLGFEAGKTVGYNQARDAMVALINAALAFNEKEKKDE